MEQVFAPWRIEWVERSGDGGDDSGCVFCELPDRGVDDDTRIVARSDHAYVLLNNYPYNPGHAMVIPYDHIGEYVALPPTVLLDHARLKAATLTATRESLDPDGFNMGYNLGGGASGGSIDDHVHAHVVPRWSGDTNFMAVVSETKVIVEALDDTLDRMRAAFADHPAATGSGETGAVLLDFDGTQTGSA